MMFIRDPDAFAKKWKRFCTDGIDKLVVISDFDYTLTTSFKPDGQRGPSSHGILMKSDVLDPAVAGIGKDLFEKYHSIEQSVHLTNAEKLPLIIEWWHKEHATLIQYKLTKQLLTAAVARSDVAFRDGFFEIFDVLAKQDVPTLIFSAGLYDVIHTVLDTEYAQTHHGALPTNVHVIANMMQFDDTGRARGFQGKLIHSLNKNASVVTDTPFWQRCQLQKRENILLLGDSIGDADMSNGLDVPDDRIIRIGFLNERVDERLDHYLAKFDVVLTHDSSMLPVELLLHQLQNLDTSKTQ